MPLQPSKSTELTSIHYLNKTSPLCRQQLSPHGLKSWEPMIYCIDRDKFKRGFFTVTLVTSLSHIQALEAGEDLEVTSFSFKPSKDPHFRDVP